MTYTRLSFPPPNSAHENIRLTVAQVVHLDKALFEQDARLTAVEAALDALDARVVVLEEA